MSAFDPKRTWGRPLPNLVYSYRYDALSSASGEAMRLRGKEGGGKAAQTRRSKRRDVPKIARGRSSVAPTKETNAQLRRERDEALEQLTESLEQQTASSEILASISGSTTDTKPVFDAIVRNLLRLFEARWACVQVVHDGIVHMPAIDGEPGSQEAHRLLPTCPR